MTDYNVISLFSGAMGLDIGLEQAGLKVLITQDFDPWCVKTIIKNGFNCIAGDIRKLINDDPSCSFLLKPTNLLPGEPFMVVGGPPCQPFSTAGRRQGINDPRGSLFKQFIHVIDKIRPRFFVMENVKGLLSAPVKHVPVQERYRLLEPEERLGSVFKIICQEFEKLGYSIVYGLVDAVHYGVPQFRERLVIIGSRNHEDIFLPQPTHFRQHQLGDYRWRTLRTAISDLEDDCGVCARFSDERLYYLRQVPMGGNWRNINPEELPKAMGGAYSSEGGKVGFFRRLHYDQPCPTIVTSPVQKATMFCHPVKDRPLSLKEYMRIQQFPDDWLIEGSVSECYKQIGNAVPIGLGRAIGNAILATENGQASIKVKRMRGTSVHENLQKMKQYVIKISHREEAIE